MGTPNKQNNLLIHTPKYSIFDISKDSKLTMPIGRIVPANHGYELMPGEEIDINLQQLCRFSPLLAPVMQRYVLDFIPCFVPYRLLWNEDYPIFNSNKFFNPNTPDDSRPSIPMTSWKQIYTNTSGKIFGSIFDYLGYPTLTPIYHALLNGVTSLSTGDSYQGAIDLLFDFDKQSAATGSITFKYLNINYSLGLAILNNTDAYLFWKWISVNYGVNASDFADLDSFIKNIPGSVKFTDLQDLYLSYLFGVAVAKVYPNVGARDLSLLPWLCYHKAISDWFIRTDIIDPDSYMSALNYASTTLSSSSSTLASFASSTPISKMITSGDPVSRLWMDDYFTTALTQASNVSAQVALPVSGTIQDFWVKNRIAEVKQRLILSGKRFIDSIRTLWGVTVPDARLQRTEILGHLKFNLVVSDVLQTSQSDIDSSLGQYAGQAISANGGHLLHYRADEPGYLMILCSVRPNTAYVDQVPRLILRKDFLDWENPMFDNVGTQAIWNNELFYRPGDTSIFGYSPRRYQEFMTDFSECHGMFKTSLDYWHAARKFDLENGVPALNHDFISMDDADSLDRIFSSQSLQDNVFCQFYFDTKVTRPLSRYVDYHM